MCRGEEVCPPLPSKVETVHEIDLGPALSPFYVCFCVEEGLATYEPRTRTFSLASHMLGARNIETDLPCKGELQRLLSFYKKGYKRKGKCAAVVTSTSLTTPYSGDQFLQGTRKPNHLCKFGNSELFPVFAYLYIA